MGSIQKGFKECKVASSRGNPFAGRGSFFRRLLNRWTVHRICRLCLVSEGLTPEGLESTREPFRNWLGAGGAYFAFWIGRQGFGIGALAWPVLLSLVAWPLITQRPILNRGKWFRFSLAWMLFTPWIGGYLATLTDHWGHSGWDHWVGATGRYSTDMGLLYLGMLGSGMVILGIIASVAMFYFNRESTNFPVSLCKASKNGLSQKTVNRTFGITRKIRRLHRLSVEDFPVQESDEATPGWDEASDQCLG